MKMNRRNVLVGLGALGIGGGALLGSGAFTSVQADRQVELHITDDTAEDFADVLVDVGTYDTVDVQNAAVSPDSQGRISLVEAGSDAVLTFGSEDNGLPPDSTVSYTDLFIVVNDDDDNSGDEFSVDLALADGDGDFLNIGGDDGGVEGVEVGPGDEEPLDATVDTGQSDETTTLDITIAPV